MVLRGFFLIFLVVGVMIVLTNLVFSFVMPIVPGEILNWLDLNEEYNFSTYYSGLLLIFAALCCAVLSFQARTGKSTSVLQYQWLGLMLVFCYLAFDEVFLIHENLAEDWDFTSTSTYLTHAWVIPVLGAVGIFVLLNLHFLLHLPTRLRRGLIFSGSLFIAGAAGVEIIGGHYWSVYGNVRDMSYQLLVTLEEGLEISGVLYFCYCITRQDFFDHRKQTNTEKRKELMTDFGVGLGIIGIITFGAAIATPLLREMDPWAVQNMFEAEALEPRVDADDTQLVMVRFSPEDKTTGLSRGSQLLIESSHTSAAVGFTIKLDKPGTYHVTAVLTEYRTFGAIQFGINRKKAGPVINLNNGATKIGVKKVSLGELTLRQENEVLIWFAAGTRAGFDGLILDALF